MRSKFCLGFTLLFVSVAICSAQQTMPPAPPATDPATQQSAPETPPAAAPAAPVPPAEPITGYHADLPPREGYDIPKKGAYGPPPDPYRIAAHDAPMPVHAIRDLPDDVAPNPPDKEMLQSKQEFWHGEWEADAIGLPLLSSDGRAVPVLYNKKDKRIPSGIKIPKIHPVTIVSGTLTVDGWTGKARLNYNIPDLRYIYLSAPAVGTVIISQQQFPGSKEQKTAFQGKTLTVDAGDHKLQLASQNELISKKPIGAWVKVDPTYTEDPRYPVMGYGSRNKPPYEWPGAKPDKGVGVLDAPPIPTMLRPRLETECEADKKKCEPPPPNPAATPESGTTAQSVTPETSK